MTSLRLFDLDFRKRGSETLVETASGSLMIENHEDMLVPET